MPICKINVKKAVKLIGAEHTRILVRLAKEQDIAENSWAKELETLNDQISKMIEGQIKSGTAIKIPLEIFERLMLANYFQTVAAAVIGAETEIDYIAKHAPEVKLAKPPKMKIPRSLAEIRELYDQYRKRGRMPKRIREMATQVQKSYLKKVQSAWRKYSASYREGDVATQENVIRRVKQAADTVVSRAKTIVRTETTNYYNQTRREIYDQTDAITHYLFLAIRDQATTRWCSDRVVEGKRGRHGLVYRKGDPLTNRETPSCHWNCRSEMVPLTPFNPRHKKLIEDESLDRRKHTCYPLPEGWR